MLVKVCGMGDPHRMHEIAQMDVDMLGFIFYARSPRYVVGKIDPVEIAKLPENIAKVGVFVNEEEETIIEEATRYHIDTIQLHGSESVELCKSLKSKGYAILKAFNLTKSNNYAAYEPYCDFFLFDTPSEQHGGTGAKFDWSLLDTYQAKTQFLLSGGIGPDDVDEVLQIKHPQLAGVDVNSKFEIKPGVKNVEEIEKFITSLPPNPLKGELNTTTQETAYLHTKNNIDNTSNSEKQGNKLSTHQTPSLGFDVSSAEQGFGGKNSMHYGAAPILFGFAKQMRANPTDAESFLWKQLSNNKIEGINFRQQHPILYFIADFYCNKAKLIIEVDGGYHNIPKQYKYDQNRDFELEELGLKVLRFTNEQVLFDIDNTIQKIKTETKNRLKYLNNNNEESKVPFRGFRGNYNEQ